MQCSRLPLKLVFVCRSRSCGKRLPQLARFQCLGQDTRSVQLGADTSYLVVLDARMVRSGHAQFLQFATVPLGDLTQAHPCPVIVSLRVTGKATSFNDLHICDVSSPEESKWSIMQADKPPPSRARHAAVVVRLFTASLLYLWLLNLFRPHVEVLSISSCVPKLT